MQELKFKKGRIYVFCDTMGERIGRIGQIYTDFFLFCPVFEPKPKKKSVQIRPIRPIRSPIVSHFCSQEYHDFFLQG
jgi:hypothetical protein